MKHVLSLEQWARKDLFQFFRQFSEPFFGVTVQADVTRAYAQSKTEKTSFFLRYLHAALAAANDIEPFRYRMEGEGAVVYDVVHASPTISRNDGSFGFAYMDYHTDFASFAEIAQAEIERIEHTAGLFAATSGENVIHFSSLRWLNFTALSHARHFAFPDSAPKISFGKVTEQSGRYTMPVSIHVHHALMDGYHVGLWVDRFQTLLDAG